MRLLFCNGIDNLAYLFGEITLNILNKQQWKVGGLDRGEAIFTLVKFIFSTLFP